MIQIEDDDLPITAAQKIIGGKRKAERSIIHKALFGTDEYQRDMFSIDEMREIAIYLMIFYLNHKEDEG